MIDSNEFIDSCKTVTAKVQQLDDRDFLSQIGDMPQDAARSSVIDNIMIKDLDTSKIMKEMGMKYRKVNQIAMSANS